MTIHFWTDFFFFFFFFGVFLYHISAYVCNSLLPIIMIILIYFCLCTFYLNGHQRSQTSYATPCNGVVSHGAQFGVFGFLPTTYAKINAKQMRSRSLPAVRRCALVCLHAQIALHAGNIDTWWTTVIEYWKSPKTPKIQPHDAFKMAQDLGSLVYICGYGIDIFKDDVYVMCWVD